jgi:Rad3-related DNA helicase
MTKIINPNVPDFVNASDRIGINDYIGENPDNIKLIEQTISDNRALLIDAPTGSGKSYVMGHLYDKWVNQEHRRCYYLLPKIIQQHQFAKTYLKDVPLINASASDEDKAQAHQFGANITWQGFLQNNYDHGLTANDIIFIDEAHLLINNQSFISETKQLVWKLQRGKYKIVLMSGTPNFLAMRDLFDSEMLSFNFNNRPDRKIKPFTIKGTLIQNVTDYLKNRDFSDGKLHVIRVNDKNKHVELEQWANDVLKLNKNQIQLINRDIADNRFASADYNYYRYLIDNEKIDPDKKLLITTIFADEGINILNHNIGSIGIFYDPSLTHTSQRCRDSVIQWINHSL